MGEKSDELGGQRVERGVVRHGFEGGAVTAAAALVIAKWGGALGISDPWQQAAALSVLVGILGGIVKFVHENRIVERLLSFLPPAPPTPPAAGTAGVILACWLSTGCAIQLGRVTPHEYHGAFGETIVACEVVGISWSAGDADICRNVEGGKVSQTFADMTLGVVRTVGSAIAGFFGGAGRGMADALAAPEAPKAVAPETTPGIDVPSTGSVALPEGGNQTADIIRAPFQ